MGKISIVLRRIILLVLLVLCLVYTIINWYNVRINDCGTIYLVDEYVAPYYETLNSNTGLTNINGISNVYINMKKDGYNIYKESVTDSFIDVSFTKDGCLSYRYYFTYPECRITFFSSDYENSYTGVSYIIEEK